MCEMTPIFLDMEQGSEQWLNCRIGIPTSSKFHTIITPSGKITTGETRRTYLMQLLAERLTGELTQTFVSASMERGTNLEPRAKSWYQFTTCLLYTSDAADE